MKFKAKKIPKKMSLSERLKRVRQRKKLSLFDVEQKTKIRVRYLKRLENGQFQLLPSPIYVKGFLKTYGQLLGLDPKDLIDQYEREYLQPEKPQDQEYVKLQKGINLPKYFITSKVIISAIVVILFLGFVSYLVLQVRGFASQPKLDLTSPQETELKTRSGGLEIAGKTDPGASVFINNQPIGLDLNGNFKEEVRLKEGINVIEVSARNKINKETIKTITISAKLPSESMVMPTETPSLAKGLKMVILVDPSPVWLSVSADGKQVFQGVILKGARQEFRADRELIINTGNAGSTHIILNDKDLGVLGHEGEVKKGIRYSVEDTGQLTKKY